MKNPNKVSSSGKLQRWQLGVGILSVVGLTTLAVVVSTSTPTNDSFSKFTTGTQISSQNASSNWTGGSDNPYRAKLSSLYVGRLDTLTTAILRKGTSMSDAQFKTYLTNLSTGISGLGSRSQYANDTEVQNILGFLVYEVNATVSALNSNSNAASVMSEVAGLINGSGSSGGQNSGNTALSTTDLAAQKAIHDQYFSLSSLKKEIKLANPTLYTQITSRSNYELSDYFNALQTKQLSGFKGSLWCLGYGRTSADANEVCSGYETSLAGNPLPNSEYETRYMLTPLPRAKKLIDGWKVNGTEKAYTAQYDRAVTLNPNFDYSSDTTQLRKFRVYLPKGTVSFSLSSFVPQWSRHAWAVKLGAPPEATRKLTNGEYVRNVTDKNIRNPNMTEYRILRGEETIVTADGGGWFGIGNERIGIYEKTIANAGLEHADDGVRQIWQNRDQYELKEGQWLYITELERDSDSYLDQMNALIVVKKPTLDNEVATLQYDSVGDPVFKGFTNTGKNDAYKGDPARAYFTDTYFESMINPTSNDPKERCINKISRWISDASYNPQSTTDPDCQSQSLGEALKNLSPQ